MFLSCLTEIYHHFRNKFYIQSLKINQLKSSESGLERSIRTVASFSPKGSRATYLRGSRKSAASIACLLLLGILLCTLIPFGAASTTFGVTSIGSSNYPETNVGVTTSDTGHVTNNYLVADQYVTSVSLTVFQISSYGQASGNVEIAIYTDNSGVPGNLISGTEVSASVTGGVWSQVTIPNTYLAAGTYWIVFDIDTAEAITSLSSGQTVGRIFQSWEFTSGLPSTAPSSGWTASGTPYDCTYFTGYQIDGYATATKAVLGDNNAVLSSLSFYSYTTGNFRLAIYSDNSGPSTLLWQSGDNPAAANAWNTVSISSGSPSSLTLQSGTYWLVWQWNSPNAGPSYTAGSSDSGNYIPLSYGAFPTTWTSGTATSQTWSIYATYSPLIASPENSFGVLIAIVACVAAFAVFRKRHK